MSEYVQAVEIDLRNLITMGGIERLLIDLYYECDAEEKEVFRKWMMETIGRLI